MGGVLVLFVVALFGLAVHEVFFVETFNLRKDSWSCTENHREARMVGKVVMPVTICDNWKRNG